MTYLDGIIAHHRQRAANDTRDLDALRAQAGTAPAGRFVRALTEHDTLAVIAEIKRRSPSKGDIDMSIDPAGLAREYARGGASCLSVLTDEQFFAGSTADLLAARNSVTLPVLRKDFTVCEHDVLDARLMGADAVLLIAAALTDRELGHLHHVAHSVGLDALVEVHDEDELRRAVAVGATFIGVNQRDLHSFSVDTERAVRLAADIPTDVVAVAESGITGPADARRCAAAGYRGVLVGEHLVRAHDRPKAVEELRVALPS